MTAILRRIATKLGMPDAAEALASRINGAELKSLLLHVMRERARHRSAPALLRQIETDDTLAPSSVDQRQFLAVDRHAFAAAAGFDAVDLAPVQPLGTAAVLGDIDQNSVLSALASTEVAGDPTTALALLAAGRRAALLKSDPRSADDVRLCTSQRVMRMQPFDNPSFTRSFRLFGLVTAGRDAGAEAFEVRALTEHIGVHLALLASLAADGYATGEVAVELADTRLTERIATGAGIDLDDVRRTVRAHAVRDHRALFASHGVDCDADLAGLARRYGAERERERVERATGAVFEAVARAHPSARLRIDPFRLEGSAYYAGYALRILVRHGDMGYVAPADGGFTTWTARALANRKERLLISGIGTEFLCKAFYDHGAAI